MTIDRQLLATARVAPEALRFADAVRLARQLGFEKVRQAGDHRIYRRPVHGAPHPLNLQESRDGRAKAYQVARMLELAEEAGRIRRGS
jgi:hypothetical protein